MLPCLHEAYIIISSLSLVWFPTDLPYFALAPLFNYFTNKIWCRTQCPDVSAQNITWCVNIAYLEEDIETCITPGNTVQPVTNSSCGAQVVGLDSFLSLPSVRFSLSLSPTLPFTFLVLPCKHHCVSLSVFRIVLTTGMWAAWG